MLIDELKNLKLKNWSAVLNEDEIIWLELNKVHKSTNTLSSEVREEFGKILSVFEKGIAGELSGKMPAGLVIHSKSKQVFVLEQMLMNSLKQQKRKTGKFPVGKLFTTVGICSKN